MLLAVSCPRHRRTRFHGFVKGDELVMRRHLRLEMWLLAGGTIRLRTIFAVFAGLVLLAAVAQHVVGVVILFVPSGNSQHGRGKVACDGEREREGVGLGCWGLFGFVCLAQSAFQVGGLVGPLAGGALPSGLRFGLILKRSGNLKDSTTQWASKRRLAWPIKTGVKGLIILGDY